jgi:hypothetical protein
MKSNGEDASNMKQLVDYLARSLVEHPDEVTLREEESENTVLMELKVADEDLGKIIGKSGSTINAIRTVLQAAAASQKKRVKLEVVD